MEILATEVTSWGDGAGAGAARAPAAKKRAETNESVIFIFMNMIRAADKTEGRPESWWTRRIGRARAGCAD